MKPFRLHFLLAFLIVSFASIAKQPVLQNDSVYFCGKHFKAPTECEVIPEGQVKCSSYVMTWNYIAIEDLKRTTQELKAQMKNPKQFDCYILGNKVQAFKEKFKPGIQIISAANINGHCVLFHLWFDKDIKSTADIPNFVKQIFKLTND